MKFLMHARGKPIKGFALLAVFVFFAAFAPEKALAGGFTMNQDTGVDPLSLESTYNASQDTITAGTSVTNQPIQTATQVTSWLGHINQWIEDGMQKIKKELQDKLYKAQDEARENGNANFAHDSRFQISVAGHGAINFSDMKSTPTTKKCAATAMRQAKAGLHGTNAALGRVKDAIASVAGGFTAGTTSSQTTRNSPPVAEYCMLTTSQFTLLGYATLGQATSAMGSICNMGSLKGS